MATNDKKTAAQMYQERAQDIGALMTWLQDELELHEKQAKDDPENWALVGDLGNVREKLTEVVTSISGLDEKAVAEALADLRN